MMFDICMFYDLSNLTAHCSPEIYPSLLLFCPIDFHLRQKETQIQKDHLKFIKNVKRGDIIHLLSYGCQNDSQIFYSNSIYIKIYWNRLKIQNFSNPSSSISKNNSRKRQKFLMPCRPGNKKMDPEGTYYF